MIKLLIVDDEKIIRETLLKHIPWEKLGIRCNRNRPEWT